MATIHGLYWEVAGVKIAFLVPNFSKIDGGARLAEVHARELTDKGNDVAIFTLNADIEQNNVAVYNMGMPKSLFWERVYRLIFPLDIVKTIRWLPRLKNFDMVIAYCYPLTWLAYLAKKFFRVKYTFWYVGLSEPQLYSRFHERISLKLHIFLTRYTTSNVDRAVAISQYSQQELKKNTGLDSEVIYSKVDTKRFHPGIDGTKIRQKHHLVDDPVILYVGAIHARKGVHLLIQAFNLAKEKIPKAKLIIVGRSDYLNYLEQLKQMSSDSVIFAGFVTDELLPLYYSMCDIYVTGSLQENFNVPLVEAQMCGKPAVVFDLGAHPEVINSNGILVEPGNIEEFARAIITIYSRQASRTK